MMKRLVLSTAMFLTACLPTAELACDDCGGGDRSTQPVTQTDAPAKVTGVRAARIEAGVQLTWKEVPGAAGYDIYREEAVISGAPLMAASLRTAERAWFVPAAGRIPGARIGRSSSKSLLDTAAAEGFQYTYRIVAFNRRGDGPPSEPFAIRVIPPIVLSWTDTWLDAPQGGIDWSAALGVAGGDAGVTTTTAFPEAVSAFAGCTQTGAEAVTVRPAIGTLIEAQPQTFALDITVNTGGHDWTYELAAYGAKRFPDVYPLYHETGAITGCTAKAIGFTFDAARVPDADIYIVVHVLDEQGVSVYADLLYYAPASRPWVRPRSTQPQRNTLLSGGELQVELEYNAMVTQDVKVALEGYDAWGMAFGSATTSISGSGSVTLAVPYRVICGTAYAWLLVKPALQDRPQYHSYYWFPVTSAAEYQVVAGDQIWRRRSYPAAWPVSGSIWALACHGQETVTLSAPSGWRVGLLDPDSGETQWGQSITGPSGRSFRFQADGDFFAMLPFGTTNSTVTAAFSGATITAPVTVNIYELFWQTAPPAIAVGGAGYPIAATVAGPRPGEAVKLTTSSGVSSPMIWRENQQRFAGTVSYPTCGIFQNYVSDGHVSAPLAFDWGKNPFVTEVTSADAMHISHASSVYLEPESGYLSTLWIRESCGKPFHWQIVYGPQWLRFEALSGTDAALPRAGLLADEAFAASNVTVYGSVLVKLQETGELLVFSAFGSKE